MNIHTTLRGDYADRIIFFRLIFSLPQHEYTSDGDLHGNEYAILLYLG